MWPWKKHGNERRAHRRVDLEVEARFGPTPEPREDEREGSPSHGDLPLLHSAIDLESPSNFYLGFASDISEGGIFVCSEELLPIDTTVWVEFTLPDDRPAARILGEVRWQRIEGAGAEAPPGMGIQFHDLAGETRGRIADFVKQREPMFFEM